MAGEFTSKYAHLHVLLNNVGAMFLQRQLSGDGIEMTFALNHLAAFLLTNLLLDTLKASAPARIINVSSGAHTSGKIEFDNLQGERAYGFGAYGNSKLANILFTDRTGPPVRGNRRHRQCAASGLYRHGFCEEQRQGRGRDHKRHCAPGGPFAAKGAETAIYLAASPSVAGITGKYFYDSHVIATAPQATDMAVARKLWDVSAEMVHLADGLPVET